MSVLVVMGLLLRIRASVVVNGPFDSRVALADAAFSLARPHTNGDISEVDRANLDADALVVSADYQRGEAGHIPCGKAAVVHHEPHTATVLPVCLFKRARKVVGAAAH